MIERATTCLENGGKHILRIPKIPFRTKRYLYSGFWSHGAGDIRLPAWWHAFLQAPSAGPPKWLTKRDSRTSRSVAHENTDFGFLDFLYPGQTLALIRTYINENKSVLRRRRRRPQLPSSRSRTYTSSADESVGLSASHEKTEQTHDSDMIAYDSSTTTGTVRASDENLRAEFHELLFDEERSINTRYVWELYQNMQQSAVPADPGDLIQLFVCLGRSSNTFDIEKTRELFDSIAIPDRTVAHYDHAISAALKKYDLAGAIAIQEEALDRAQPLYKSSILKYAILNSKWDAAVAVWKQFNDDKRYEHLLWKEIKTWPLSDLFAKATEAFDFAYDLDDAVSALNFAVTFARKVLRVQRKDFDQSLQAMLMEKVQSIQHPLTLGLLTDAMVQCFSVEPHSREHNQGGLDLYAIARTSPDFAPSMRLLDTILLRCLEVRSSQGTYDVLDDYRRLYKEPPRGAYRLLAFQLARQGDFATVDQLFQESMARFGHEDDGDISILAPQLLHACYRRGEPGQAVNVIDSLQRQYGYSLGLRTWNNVLATYARVGDCDGAVALWRRLTETDIRPDSFSYGILMGMFAKRSDYDAANMLFEQALSEGVKPNVDMITSLVLAHATNDRLEEAQGIAEETIDADSVSEESQAEKPLRPRSFTRMWNVLLGQYAIRGQLDKVFDIQKRMHELGVAFDGLTYAALMQSLCIKKLPTAAQKILKSVMPKQGIRPTALHYAIVISGFVAVNDYPVISSLQKRMVADGIRPSFSTQNALLRHAAAVDEREHASNSSEKDTFQAVRAESVLSETLDSIDPMELATLGPTKFAQTNPPNIALQASYFPFLIALYGRKRSFEKVTEMYNLYVSTVGKANADLVTSPPIEMLSALMISYTSAGQYDETKNCWQLALEKSKEIARKANGDTSQPGWVLHKYRFILTLPLTRYMQAIQATSGVDKLSAIIASLQHDGFQLSVHNWNKYVQILIEDKDPVLAYEICEKQLMDGWPGWERFGNRIRVKRKIKKQWVPMSWELSRPFPHYETFVYLASAYLEAQSMAYGAGKEMLQEFERVAPRTVEAVQKLPRIDDTIQQELLNRD